MKLHLLASFRTHFSLKDEEVLASPGDYQTFWNDADKAASSTNSPFSRVLFLHKANDSDSELSRFRSVDTDSLSRPLHLMEIHLDPADTQLQAAWRSSLAAFPAHASLLERLELIDQSASIRIYNNSVALLQVDIDASEYAKSLGKGKLGERLDILQEFGVTFGERLSQLEYRENLYGFLHKLTRIGDAADRFIFVERFDFDMAMSNAVLTQSSSRRAQTVRVNWVTRTLLFDAKDRRDSKAIAAHWLKDCGDKDLIKKAQDDPGAYAMRWLNHLFREHSYALARKENGEIDYAQAFSDEWQAMLNAQYYYAAFESLNDSLTATLAHSYRKPGDKGKRTTGALRELSRQLEKDIIAANLATLEYHNNFAYYKRKVSITMKEIMHGWDFEEAILKEVTRKTDLCEQRIDELHKKAESRSGFYSDLLLLAIALISVSAFLFQVNEYGRTMSHNAELAVYESNTWNLIKFISERPTDFVIWLSVGLIIFFGALYAWFRRLKVMD